MRVVGNGHPLSARDRVRQDHGEYVVELDVSDFTEAELAVEVLGQRVTVHGAQSETPVDKGEAFRLQERLDESFRLPDDADADRIKVFYKHGTLELHTPLTRAHTVPIEHPRSQLVNPDAEPC
jgi:HSP20 family molecular chaperone IbpA